MGVIRKLQWSLEQRGVTRTIAAAATSLVRKISPPGPPPPHPFDVQHGTDTGGYIAGHDLGMGHAHDRFITGYAGISPSIFVAAMEMWASSGIARPVSDYTFIDAGCGKGRAVMLASQFGFREVVGVELNRELANVAEANVAIWTAAGKALCPIRIVCGDVLDFPLPQRPLLVYLYNPFGEPVVRALAELLKQRHSEYPEGVEVVYQKAEHAEVFEQGFKLIWSKALAISAEERKSDSAADDRDETRAYRL